ncbi:MAG: helix-turn-helix transcriptional regulator [Micromonosporaceae bacterium]
MKLRVRIHVRGRPGLVIDRPHGSGDVVFVHFLEPALLSRDGRLAAPAGSCVVYGPSSPTYAASETTIYNSFVHISTDLADDVLAAHPVPLDEPVTPRSTEFVLPLLSRLQREWVQRETHWKSAVRLCVADLFLHLSRGLTEATTSAATPHAARLREVRLTVHRSPADRWTVPRMAALAHLKESQFSVLYRRLFGVTPAEDLIQVRLDLAKYYLAHYELAVAEVAELSGFTDVSYFSRCFHRRVGCPPSRYRQGAPGAGPP